MKQHDFIPNTESFFRAIIEKLDTDILFECFAGLLIRSGEVDAGAVHVIPIENYSRNYKNDIIAFSQDEDTGSDCYFELGDEGFLTMYTSRSAVLDYLPEDLYIEPDNTSEFYDEKGERKSVAEIEAYRRKQKEHLKSTERFFRPLEVEYNKVRIERELEELNRLENFDGMLERFWEEFPLTNERWKRFVRTLHLVPAIVGDKDKTKALIEFVLGVPVTLSFTVEECCEVTRQEQQALTGEEMVLGFNMLVGNTIYDYLEVCTLKIENLSTEEFFKYFDEKTEDRKLLDEIIKYYFLLDVEVKLDFSIKDELDKDEEKVLVLGYSSKLGV